MLHANLLAKNRMFISFMLPFVQSLLSLCYAVAHNQFTKMHEP
jgi:hypothetical protein